MERLGEEVSSENVNLLVNELFDEFNAKILPRLLGIVDETKRYLYFTAWLNVFLEKKKLGRIVITGGFAVEVYTGRVYRTMDVDVIVEGGLALKVIELFIQGFSERLGRGYLPRYDILQLKSIDIVSTMYRRASLPTKLLVDELHVYLDPVEDLIITYLVGWKHWNATEDRDKAYWLYAVWRDRIDRDYLVNRAREERVEDYLEILEKMPVP